VKVLVKTPGASEFKDSQIAYNKAFREALDSGALLRQKLTDYMTKQGLWNEDKQNEYERKMEEISSMEDALKGGGIRLSEAKEIAIQLKDRRVEFRELISERNSLDAASAEGQADNARFAALVRLCALNPDSNTKYFQNEKDYEAQSSQPWVVAAAEKLGNILYGLDPNYENNLEENKFLKEFDFVNEELQYVNEDGHTIDSDGRLTNEDGRFIAYRNDEDYKKRQNSYFVNKEGEEVAEIDGEWVKASLAERKPFLDDSDKPILKEGEKKTTSKTRKTKATKKDTTAT
jgi:hypothetical protein